MKVKTKHLVLLIVWCVLSAPINVLGNSWGFERGRANEGDAARLLVDQLALKMAQNRIMEAIARPLAVERKKQLLGVSGANTNPAALLDGVYKWWLTDVMEPANAIAGNPAASCNEAKVAVNLLLGLMHQRQSLGISPEEGDKSVAAYETRAREAEINEMLDGARTKLAVRCREEALDECVVTGRFSQIIETDLGLSRQEALFPTFNGSDSNDAWVDDSLKQCAIYELHFVSTTRVAQLLNLETVLDGKIKLKFEAGVLSARLGGKKFGDLLRGETSGGANPFLVSVKCSQPRASVTCSPGATTSAVMARINEMELKHREFYVDQSGISRERIVGEDKLAFDFGGGLFSIQALIRIPNGGTYPFPLPAQGFAFYIAHKKDRLGEGSGEGTTVKVERYKRGAYPVIFDFPYADENTDSKVSASDSTEFQLIHKPEPRSIERAPEPRRKPLRPRPE